MGIVNKDPIHNQSSKILRNAGVKQMEYGSYSLPSFKAQI